MKALIVIVLCLALAGNAYAGCTVGRWQTAQDGTKYMDLSINSVSTQQFNEWVNYLNSRITELKSNLSDLHSIAKKIAEIQYQQSVLIDGLQKSNKSRMLRIFVDHKPSKGGKK